MTDINQQHLREAIASLEEDIVLLFTRTTDPGLLQELTLASGDRAEALRALDNGEPKHALAACQEARRRASVVRAALDTYGPGATLV